MASGRRYPIRPGAALFSVPSSTIPPFPGGRSPEAGIFRETIQACVVFNGGQAETPGTTVRPS